MTKRSLQHLLKLSVLTAAAVLTLSARADLQEHNDNGQQRHDDGRDHGDNRRDRDDDDRDHDDDHRGRHHIIRLATGQYVTPTIINDAEQQYLNPGLAAYPDFIAGEAVRSQLSPDGTTLAVLTAGPKPPYKTDATGDAADPPPNLFL